MLRRGLAHILGVPPSAVPLVECPSSGVRLEGCNSHVYVSLLRAGRFAVAACSDRPVGIDLAELVPQRDLDDVMRLRFPEHHQSRYFATVEIKRPQLFYEMWTAAEAVLKALRLGLTVPLACADEVANEFAIARPAVPAGYACALAVHARHSEICEVRVS
jgi:phosphopantetheinyl transferase